VVFNLQSISRASPDTAHWLDMKLKTSAAPFVPAVKTLSMLRTAAAGCQGCELYRSATQTVFGEGPAVTPMMLIGETPGDREDKAGQPFIGPAGQLLGRVLEQVGLPRTEVYITNAVKHFRWTLRGDRRIHQKPTGSQIQACRPWLEAEIEAVKPRVIVCLGAVAAQTLLGSSFRITLQRGQVLPSQWAEALVATYHPAAILRVPTDEERRRMLTDFTTDLHLAVQTLNALAPR